MCVHVRRENKKGREKGGGGEGKQWKVEKGGANLVPGPLGEKSLVSRFV